MHQLPHLRSKPRAGPKEMEAAKAQAGLGPVRGGGQDVCTAHVLWDTCSRIVSATDCVSSSVKGYMTSIGQPGRPW